MPSGRWARRRCTCSARPRGTRRARRAISTCLSTTSKGSRFSAIELLRIKHYLSDALDIESDVTTRGGLHPLIRDQIVASARASVLALKRSVRLRLTDMLDAIEGIETTVGEAAFAAYERNRTMRRY
jgi:hypothetical protein